MNSNAPLISSAGRNHVLLSKQLCVILTVLLICGGFLFFRMQQSAVKRSMLNKEHVKQQNEILRQKNIDMMEAKKKLETDEKELTKMYETWLTDDGKDLALTKDQIKELQDKIDEVQASQEAHESILSEKETALADKENVLTSVHDQLREKNLLIKSMKMQIVNRNGTLPTMLAEMPDDDDWAW